jgi:hypothetical protein
MRPSSSIAGIWVSWSRCTRHRRSRCSPEVTCGWCPGIRRLRGLRTEPSRWTTRPVIRSLPVSAVQPGLGTSGFEQLYSAPGRGDGLGWQGAGAGWLEPHGHRGHRPGRRRGTTATIGRGVPQRHRHRSRWQWLMFFGPAWSCRASAKAATPPPISACRNRCAFEQRHAPAPITMAPTPISDTAAPVRLTGQSGSGPHDILELAGRERPFRGSVTRFVARNCVNRWRIRWPTGLAALLVTPGGADVTRSCGLLIRGLWVRVPRGPPL